MALCCREILNEQENLSSEKHVKGVGVVFWMLNLGCVMPDFCQTLYKQVRAMGLGRSRN